MSPALANFLFEAANFLLLAAALGWLLFKPVRRALEAERARHQAAEETAKRLQAEAESLAQATRATRDAAHQELQQRQRELLAAAQREATQIVEAARTAQATERRRLEQELATRRDTEAVELAELVGRIAAASVRSFLGTLDGPSLDLALVRAARAELDAVPAAARKAALVESARPLSADTRALLAGVLGDGFKERVVDALGAGVRVTTAAGQVDATAIALARRAALGIKETNGNSVSRRETSAPQPDTPPPEAAHAPRI